MKQKKAECKQAGVKMYELKGGRAAVLDTMVECERRNQEAVDLEELHEMGRE